MKSAPTEEPGPLAVIDQARIDAPHFPRSQDWWTRWVPGYVTAEVREDGTVALGITGESRSEFCGRRPAELVRRNQEQAFLRWFGRHRARLEPAIVEDGSEGGPCPCWRGPCFLHDRHCCFRTASVCHKIPEGCAS